MDEIRQKLNQFVPKANILKTAGWILLFFLGIVATLLVIHGVTTQRLQIGMNWLIFISVLIGFVVIISLLRLLYFYLKERSPNLNEKILTPESISNQKEKEIYEIVQSLSNKAGLKKMPLIKIVYSDEVNAMAMSLSKNNSIIYLYDGIIRTMDRESLEAVIAHEIGHIYNGDSVTSVFLYNFTTAIWILVAVVPYIILTINALTIKDRTVRAIMLGIINLAFFIVSRIILFASSMVVNFHSRFREFKADKFASIVTSPEAMKRGLEKLKESLSLPVADDYAILKINMPVVFDFFSTHPHLDRRIRAIEEFMAQPVARTSEERKEQVRGYFILGTIMASVIVLLLSFSSGGSSYDKSQYQTQNPKTVTSDSEPKSKVISSQYGIVIGGKEHDEAKSIQQTTDGGFIVVGDTYSFGANKGNMYVLKFDKNGNLEWQKTYGDKGGYNAQSIQKTPDEGYIVLGSVEAPGLGRPDDIAIMKLSKDWNIQMKIILRGETEKWDVAETVQQTSDGGYIMAGWTEILGTGWRDVLVLKLDREGNIQWQKIMGVTRTMKANPSRRHQTVYM